MSQIPLHPDKGLDPHLTYCPRCGGEGRALTIGHLKKAQLDTGQWIYANRGYTHKTRRELEKQGYHGHLSWEDVEEYEKVPDSAPCEKCEQEIEEWNALIEEGGVHWQCKGCSLKGIIKAEHPLSGAVRKEAGVPAPKPCGVEFEKCEEHGGAPDGQKVQEA